MKPYKLQEHELSTLVFPLLATPKIDGIRCTKIDGRALTASHKPIPNLYIRELIERSAIPNGFDGEIVCPGTFQETTSSVMTVGGTPAFCWRVFDFIYSSLQVPYTVRVMELDQWFKVHKCGYAEPVLPEMIHSTNDLLDAEEACLESGYEGIILRKPFSPYKNGRSTLREQYLMAIKRFVDSEALLIGMTELMHNANEAQINELGLTKRSSHQANQIPAGKMGTLRVRDLRTNVEFEIGTGFDNLQRVTLWAHRDTYIGRIIKYKSFPFGVKEAPRSPVFLGFRDPKDMTYATRTDITQL